VGYNYLSVVSIFTKERGIKVLRYVSGNSSGIQQHRQLDVNTMPSFISEIYHLIHILPDLRSHMHFLIKYSPNFYNLFSFKLLFAFGSYINQQQWKQSYRCRKKSVNI